MKLLRRSEDRIPAPNIRLPDPNTVKEQQQFWCRYDKLADLRDSDLLRHMNENLDVLLIFVSTDIPILMISADRLLWSDRLPCSPQSSARSWL